MQTFNLTNHFLMAMPNVTAPHFARALIYLAEHNEQGALGLIVNRPLNLTLGDFLERIEATPTVVGVTDLPIFFGGPVQPERGFVLHRPPGRWQSSLRINAQMALTTSRDILQAVATTGKPKDLIVALGYAGWSAGQLESELAQNAWLTVESEPHILFDLPYEERLSAAMRKLGIDPANFAGQAGHA